MDAPAHKKITALKPKDWEKLGYTDSTTANDGGLTNEIDPIFRYKHPSRSTPVWNLLGEAQYEDILMDLKPMLQLASLLLRSSPSLNADYDLLYVSPLVQVYAVLTQKCMQHYVLNLYILQALWREVDTATLSKSANTLPTTLLLDKVS